jgi:hypothetical protein
VRSFLLNDTNGPKPPFDFVAANDLSEPNSIALSAPSEVLEEREADLRRVRELPFHDLKS